MAAPTTCLCRIPKRLQPAFVKPDGTPQVFLKVALGIKDAAEARRLARRAAADGQVRLDVAEQRLKVSIGGESRL